MKSISKAAGFTLIELIAVIIILGVVGTAVISFIGFSAQLFVDVNGRDKVLADSRFVVERLNRELRDAVPNSVRIAVASDSSIQCLEFMPIEWSSFYLDLAVIPDPPSNVIRAVQLGINSATTDSYNFDAQDFVIVYPTSLGDVYNVANGKRAPINIPAPQPDNNGLVTITLENNIAFAEESPASRLYIAGQPISYCVSNTGDITRHTGYPISTVQSVNRNVIGNGILMGVNLQNVLSTNLNNSDNPFRVIEPTLQRNAFIHILLRFARQDEPSEVVVFNNEVHIANVP